MLVIAIVLIVVVGPKDLPRMLRTFGKTTAKLRGMAGDFQRQFNEALKEAELDDVKKSVDELRGLNPASEIRKQLNPFEKAASDIRSGLDNALKSTPAPQPAEPVKAGAAAMPGVAGPDAMPAAPAFPAASSEPAGTAAKPKKKAAARSGSTKAASKAVDASAPAKTGVKTKPAAAKTAASASKAPAKAAADKPAKPKAAAAPKAKKAAAEKTSAGNAK
ncbi:sec-independent protein translocase protein TatB [Pseudaminobacter salicylatoxidans]|uniref:Sec-independent protein translocase protein TatB n=2 Tax=Pseudaminobacter salicylatoxidans TaxID=93369 RepID=A0A316BYA7_PSESE|nr:sec-independent protein translocase protein TatB [Pseudaminobacter salicylatoxidans]